MNHFLSRAAVQQLRGCRVSDHENLRRAPNNCDCYFSQTSVRRAIRRAARNQNRFLVHIYLFMHQSAASPMFMPRLCATNTFLSFIKYASHFLFFCVTLDFSSEK